MKEKKIKIPIFNTDMFIIYGNRDDVAEGMNKKYEGLNFTNTSNHNGHYQVLRNGEFRDMCVIIYEGYEDQYIYHESLHAAYDILDYVGVEVTVNDDEALAYLMEYIADQVLRTLKKWNHG